MQNKRWKANNGEQFWYIDSHRNEASNYTYWRPQDFPHMSWGWLPDGKPPERTWMDDVYDFGNMFQTREEALQVLDKWNKVLKEHWGESMDFPPGPGNGFRALPPWTKVKATMENNRKV